MENISDTISTRKAETLQSIHDDLSQADETIIGELLKQLADSSREVYYLDDYTIHTIDRADNSKHSHINQKEIVSGDATVWLAVEDEMGQTEKQFEIQYEVYAGSSNNIDGFIYNPIEITMKFK